MSVSLGRYLAAILALGACSAEPHAPAGSGASSSSPVTGTANTAVTWSVQEPGGGTISASGLYSAPATDGTYHVVAVCTADPNISAAATVIVTTPSPGSIAISPNPAVVAAGGTQQFTVTPAQSVTWSVTQTPVMAAPAYPLKVSSDGRYLVDQNGQPWRIQADAAWGMATKATPAQVDTYLSTRKAQGFNSFYLWPIAHPGGYPASLPNAPRNYAGVAPFTGTPFIAPDEAYWSWIDTIIDKAAAHGMVVMFAFEYLGYPGTEQGWDTEVAARSLADSTAWGAWLGNRYKHKGNIIWFALGDQTPSGGTLQENHIAAINAIKSAGATQPWMAEPMGGNSNPIMDAPAYAPLIDLNSFYGYGSSSQGDCYPQADRAYRNTPAKPVWVQEGGYEYENNTGGFPPGSYHTRRTRFWSVLAGGIAGDGFGSRDVYQWLNFPACLSTPGATFSKHAFDLLASLPWWKLQPSGTGTGFAGKTLITAGGGTWGGMDYVTSAVTSDGGYLLAYVPTTGGTTARTFSVDMSALGGPARAMWWDPATGTSTLIGTGLVNSGNRSFTTPGMNGGGQNDWVLLLDAAGTEGCGTISSSGLYSAPPFAPVGIACQVRAVLQSNPTVVANAQLILP